jgi:VWFA-related protein
MPPTKPILLALTLTLAAHAQSTPTLKVYSRETIVDVTITDAQGQPVHNLKQSDFTLKEDGKPQPIRSFHEYTTQTVPPLPTLPPNVYTNLQPPAGDITDILLIDGLNMAPVDSTNAKQIAFALGNQTRARLGAKQYLETLPPGTKVAIFELSSQLRILQGFTPDPSLLRAVVDTTQLNMNGRASSKEAWCSQRDAWNKSVLESLQQIAAYVTPIKGKKDLIWLTVPFPSLTDAAQRPGCLPDYSKDLHKIYDLLMAAQVSLYPVDVRGVTLAPALAEDLSLESLAEATGGAAFYNNNDLANLIGKAFDSGASYYTLSYVPPGTQYDGRHHTINLETTQPGLHLVYRHEYYAEDPAAVAVTAALTLATSPPQPTAGNIQASMGRSVPLATGLLFDVQVSQAPNPPPHPSWAH